MLRPSGTSATNGRLRKVGSLSLRSSRLTNTVVLADARSGGVPTIEGVRETYSHKHAHRARYEGFISPSKRFHDQHKT